MQLLVFLKNIVRKVKKSGYDVEEKMQRQHWGKKCPIFENFKILV